MEKLILLIKDIFNFILSHLDSTGLFFTFLGTIFIALYISVDKNEYVEGKETNGKKWFSVIIKYPILLTIGFFLICLGFIFSFAESLLK